MSKPNNPYVFPLPGYASGHPGLTLLDYFAAHALVGLLANGDRSGPAKDYAHDAYIFAKHMLQERDAIT